MLSILLTLVSCSPDSGRETFTVSTWNMCQFFDAREDGSEMDGWREKDGWNGKKYQERIDSTVKYMASNMKDTDFIVLEEVESASILEDLLEGGLKREGYLYYGLAQEESGMLSVGFISRLRPESVSAVTVRGGRPMVSVVMNINGERVRIVGVHLRSRLTDENEEIRREEMEAIKSMALNDDIPLIVLGDFNADPFIHTSEISGERNEEAVLLLSGDGREGRGGVLFSPFLDYGSPLLGGTYYYSGMWEKLDNVLLSSHFFDWEGIEYKESEIVKGGGASDSAGRPMKYDKATGLGYSDHFALKVTFTI